MAIDFAILLQYFFHKEIVKKYEYINKKEVNTVMSLRNLVNLCALVIMFFYYKDKATLILHTAQRKWHEYDIVGNIEQYYFKIKDRLWRCIG